MVPLSIGAWAESLCAEYFVRNLRHDIVARNWRTRWCEIDLITRHKGVIFFVEVKYREHSAWGGGLEAVNSKKVAQMNFAAQMWCSSNQWDGNAELLAVSMCGEPPTVERIVSVDW